MVTNQSDEPMLDVLLNRESAWESLQYHVKFEQLIELLFNLNHRLLQNMQYELGMEM